MRCVCIRRMDSTTLLIAWLIAECAYLQEATKSVAVLSQLLVSFEFDSRLHVSAHGNEVGNTLARVDQALDQSM